MASSHARRPSAAGSLKERPLPRLLQQLFRKSLTGCLSISDQTGDISEVFLRSGYPVHVQRPVDSDRLDRVLIESGLVTERTVEMAQPMVASGLRMGEALERMGALTRNTLSNILKKQVRRKITRLFCVHEGHFEIFLEDHPFGEGEEWMTMRVDPRALYFLAIRTAYDLSRVTAELSRLWGQQFRLIPSSLAYLDAMRIPDDDPVVLALRTGWQTLEKIDPLAARPFESRSTLLALYYSDLLERQNLVNEATDEAVTVPPSTDNLIPSPSGELPEMTDEPAVPEAVAEYVNTPAPLSLVPPAPAAAQASPERALSIPPSTSPPMSAPVEPPAPVTPPPPILSPLSIAPSAPVTPPAPARSSPSPDVRSIPPAIHRSSPSPETGSRSPARLSPSPDAGNARTTASSMPAVPTVDQALRTALTKLAQQIDQLSFFELLEVSESAPVAEISAAFFRAARRYHPDRLAGAGLAEMAPQAERVLARMSEAAMTLGDPAKRAAYLAERSGKTAPDSTVPSVFEAETSFLKGEVFLKKGDHAKAIECFTAACKANPNEPQFRAYLAWARFDNPKGRKEAVVREVQRTIDEVVASQPKFARGHYWLGLIWKFLNEPDRAERCFREAVEQDGKFIEATRELRLCEMRRQRGGNGANKGPQPPRGGLMGRLFKK